MTSTICQDQHEMTSNSNPAEWLREMIRIETEGERSPKLPPIKTYYDPKPVPDEAHDWVAYFDGFEPGEPIGYGATRDAAITALLREVGQ